jgi:hypothetical protein
MLPAATGYCDAYWRRRLGSGLGTGENESVFRFQREHQRWSGGKKRFSDILYCSNTIGSLVNLNASVNLTAKQHPSVNQPSSVNLNSI